MFGGVAGRCGEAARRLSGGAVGTQAGQEAPSWEGKAGFLFHLDLGGELLTQSLTLAHYLHIWCIHGFAFQLVRARCQARGARVNHGRLSLRGWPLGPGAVVSLKAPPPLNPQNNFSNQ